jgi:hypothetical protein
MYWYVPVYKGLACDPQNPQHDQILAWKPCSVLQVKKAASARKKILHSQAFKLMTVTAPMREARAPGGLCRGVNCPEQMHFSKNVLMGLG